MATVTTERLTKRYDAGGEPAVRDLDLEIADGELMVLLGPSGCGKSTALRMVAGLEPITSGTVRLDGAVMNEVPAKARDIAMVFQSYALYPHMSVYENIAFALRRRRVPRPEIERRVRATADKLGLAPFLERRPHALSGGQRQRVALGRAIVRNPKVFLFDEPLSNLDAALRVTTRNELIRLQAELGTTAIYVTHDQVEAMTMGHRICIMSKGAAVQIGRPLEVYRRPADTFVARFLGNPPMNLLPARIEAAADRPGLRLGGAWIELPPGPAGTLPRGAAQVILGIRPEDLYVAPPPDLASRAAALPAQVAAVEPLGAETLLVLTLEGMAEEVIARIGRDTDLRPGDHQTMVLDSGAIHLFDVTTTRRLRDAGS